MALKRCCLHWGLPAASGSFEGLPASFVISLIAVGHFVAHLIACTATPLAPMAQEQPSYDKKAFMGYVKVWTPLVLSET